MVKDNKILIKNLSLIKDKKRILDNINLNIPIKKVVCLVGPSGCGKTSLLRAIAGLDKFNSGSLFFDNKMISDSHHSLPTENRNIGLVFQEANLFPHLNVFKNISFGDIFKNNSASYIAIAWSSEIIKFIKLFFNLLSISISYKF